MTGMDGRFCHRARGIPSHDEAANDKGFSSLGKGKHNGYEDGWSPLTFPMASNFAAPVRFTNECDQETERAISDFHATVRNRAIDRIYVFLSVCFLSLVSLCLRTSGAPGTKSHARRQKCLIRQQIWGADLWQQLWRAGPPAAVSSRSPGPTSGRAVDLPENSVSHFWRNGKHVMV